MSGASLIWQVVKLHNFFLNEELHFCQAVYYVTVLSMWPSSRKVWCFWMWKEIAYIRAPSRLPLSGQMLLGHFLWTWAVKVMQLIFWPVRWVFSSWKARDLYSASTGSWNSISVCSCAQELGSAPQACCMLKRHGFFYTTMWTRCKGLPLLTLMQVSNFANANSNSISVELTVLSINTTRKWKCSPFPFFNPYWL